MGSVNLYNASAIEGGAEPVSCEMQTLCFFGTKRCEQMPGWHYLAEYEMTQVPTTTTTTTVEVTTTTTTTLPARDHFWVTVIFGILPSTSAALVGENTQYWEYDK